MKKVLTLLVALMFGMAVLTACAGDTPAGTPTVDQNSAGATGSADGGTVATDPLAVDVPEGAIVESMTFAELEAALDGIKPKADQTSYAEVATLMGVQGKFYDDEQNNERSVNWYASDDGYASFLFRLDTGLMFGGWGVQPEGRPAE